MDVKLPSIEVRYSKLSVEAECQVVEGKPMPTLWNAAKGAFSVSVIIHWTSFPCLFVAISDGSVLCETGVSKVNRFKP